MASKREVEKQRKKATIIDAAEQLFFSKGYEQATMDDLRAAAHLSKRTLYVYFTSKEQIYFEIMIRGYKKLIALLDEAPQTASVIERLRHMADTFYQFSKMYPQYFSAIFSYENRTTDFTQSVPDPSKEECYALGEVVLGKFTALLQQGKNEGVLQIDQDVTLTAMILWSSMSGVLRTAKLKKNYLENDHAISPESLINQAFVLMMRSIRNNSGDSLK